jgi:hypothetical protein
MAHKINLVLQALFNLLMMAKLEELFQSLYFYFSSSLNDSWNSLNLLISWKQKD